MDISKKQYRSTGGKCHYKLETGYQLSRSLENCTSTCEKYGPIKPRKTVTSTHCAFFL